MARGFVPKIITDPDLLPECKMVYLCSKCTIGTEEEQGIYCYYEPAFDTQDHRDAHKTTTPHAADRRQQPPMWGDPVISPWSIQEGECPDFYSRHTFVFEEPDIALEWLNTIGRTNVFHLRKAGICLWKQHYDGPTWCRVLNAFAPEARQLRRLYVFWDDESPYEGRDGENVDLGADVDFVRALAEFRGLKVLTLDGFYAKEWPRYLSEKLTTTYVALAAGERDEYREELAEFQAKQKDLNP